MADAAAFITRSRKASRCQRILLGQPHEIGCPAEGEARARRAEGTLIDAPSLEWLAELMSAGSALESARSELRRAIEFDDSIAVQENLNAVRQAFESLQRLSQSGFEELDNRVSRPPTSFHLPPALEFAAIPINGTGNCMFLLESPEPFDWARMKLTCEDAEGHASPIAVVWKDDGTQAFIIRSDGAWFTAGAYRFTFEYSGDPNDYPELEPVTMKGSPVKHEVSCMVELSL